MILTHQGPLSSRVRLPVGSDNQGNVMAMLNLGSKKPYTAAILMELVFLLHTHGCSLAANHVPREFNQWADELTHPDFSGFDPLHRVPKQELCEEFVFLPRLLVNGDAFDLSVLPLVADPPVAWVPRAPAQGRALSVCTPVLQFLRVCGGWPMGPTQPLTSDRGR